MATILLSLPIVLLSVAGLALGWLIGREPLAGGCGAAPCQRRCAGCDETEVERAP